MAAGLVAGIDDGGDDGGGHGFELLHGHEAGGVLGADDVYFDADIGAGVEDGAGGGADGVAVEDFLNGGEALAFFGDFLGRGEDGGCLDAEGFGGEGLEFFPEDDGVGAAGFHEFHFLGRERLGDVDEFLAFGVVELFGLGVDGEEGAGLDGVGLLEDGVAVFVFDGVAFGVGFPDPVLEVEADAAGDVNGGEEDG